MPIEIVPALNKSADSRSETSDPRLSPGETGAAERIPAGNQAEKAGSHAIDPNRESEVRIRRLESKLLSALSVNDIIHGASLRQLQDIFVQGRMIYDDRYIGEWVRKKSLQKRDIVSVRNFAAYYAHEDGSEPVILRFKSTWRSPLKFLPPSYCGPVGELMEGVIRPRNIDVFDPIRGQWVPLKSLAKALGWKRPPSSPALSRSEQARLNGLLALLHVTKLDMLPNIIDDGALLSCWRLFWSGRLFRIPIPKEKRLTAILAGIFGSSGGFGFGGIAKDGVYLTGLAEGRNPVDQSFMDESAKYATLVFSLAPLNRRDYYANGAWAMGDRNAGSIYPRDMVGLVRKIVRGWTRGANEFVFSRWKKFSLLDLREIWVLPKDVENTVEMLERTRFKLPPGLSWSQIVVGRVSSPDAIDSPPLRQLYPKKRFRLFIYI